MVTGVKKRCSRLVSAMLPCCSALPDKIDIGFGIEQIALAPKTLPCVNCG